MLDELNSFPVPVDDGDEEGPSQSRDGRRPDVCAKEIESWFALGKKTSPLTGAELPSTNLAPNTTLLSATPA